MADKLLLGRLVEKGIMTNDDAVRMADYKPSRSGKRSFNSAQVSRLTSGMATMPKPIDVDVRNGLRKLRARSRHEAQNNDYVKRFLSLLKTNVIGSKGIVKQSNIKDPDGKKDKLANDAVNLGWKDWGKKGVCDVTGRLSWIMVQQLYLETCARDGEVLIRKVRNWTKNKFRFALQFLDVELLDVDLNTDLRNGHKIQMGVELDEWRRPVAYYLLTTKQTDYDYSFTGRKYQRIPADEIIHEYLPEWVWQTRGIPWVASCLMRLNMLDGYEESELVASRAGSATFANYERIEGESPAPDLSGSLEKDAEGEFLQDFEPGTIGISPEGYKLNLLDPQHPNAVYKDFVKTSLRGATSGMGLGVSYNSLSNDLEGVNFNSLRKGALDEQDAYMLLQEWVVESLCENVASEWLNLSLLSQALTVNNKPLDFKREEKYQATNWQPRRWQWVDPLKMMNAHEKGLLNKISSPQEVIRERGRDPEDVLDEIQSWHEMLKERNLTHNEPAPDAGSSFTEDEEDDDISDANKNS